MATMHPTGCERCGSRRRPGLGPALAALGLALSAGPSAAQFEWEFDPDAVQPWIERGMAAMDRVFGAAQSNWTERLTASFHAHMTDLLAAADAAMQEAHPEDMAELQPYLRAAVTHAGRIRELAPYAAWLDARLDYFDAARSAVTLVPMPPPVIEPPPPRPRPPPQPSPSPAPAPRPPVTPPPRPTVRPSARVVVPPDIERKRIETAVARPAWRKRVAARTKPANAGDLVPTLKRAFRDAGVPQELVWIAEVESTMNPDARSPRGAVGLYQITAPTARSLGLSLSPADERRDPAKSAAAAARYLRRLHDRFGSWPLALAAYNAGEGRISGLLKKHGATDFDGIAPSLPMETRMYVPRVLETVRLREGVDPDRLPPPGDVAI